MCGNRFALTDPEVIEPLAHGAMLVWDLVEVLVKTWLERDESRQGREVVFWETRARSVQTLAVSFRKKSSQGSATSTSTRCSCPGLLSRSPAMVTEGSLLPLADSYADFTIRRLKSNCRENRSHTSTLLSLHRPQSSTGPTGTASVGGDVGDT